MKVHCCLEQPDGTSFWNRNGSRRRGWLGRIRPSLCDSLAGRRKVERRSWEMTANLWDYLCLTFSVTFRWQDSSIKNQNTFLRILVSHEISSDRNSFCNYQVNETLIFGVLTSPAGSMTFSCPSSLFFSRIIICFALIRHIKPPVDGPSGLWLILTCSFYEKFIIYVFF